MTHELSKRQLESFRTRALISYDYDMSYLACDALGLDRSDQTAVTTTQMALARQLVAGMLLDSERIKCYECGCTITPDRDCIVTDGDNDTPDSAIHTACADARAARS